MSDPCQRWSRGRDSYRPPFETINPSRHDVQLIDELTAKGFIETHHYSHSYPAARLRVGLYRKMSFARDELVGCAVFSVPMNQHAITAHTGLEPKLGVELGRFCLLNSVESNGESWFLARALRLMREHLPEVRAVVSYSDPVPRQIGDREIKPGHIGQIYKVSSFVYKGRARARTLLISRRTGQVVSERALSKLKAADRGRDYALKQLRDLGAPGMHAGETPEAYLARVLESDMFMRFRHPGNFVYVTATGGPATRREVRKNLFPSLPYPTRSDAPCLL